MSPNLATVIVGISGVSSSGKTTLARLLRDIFPGSFILHEDDFYWPDEKIPVRKGNQDWDCLESLDLQRFYNTLDFIKRSGSIPSDLDSKEDQNSAGASNVDPNVVEELKLRTAKYRYRLNLVIVEGFLLYAQPMQHIWSLLDTRLFLRTSYQIAKQRRESRPGYVTIEGFWEDPPGYVDDVVWPNYVKNHAFLFQDGNVEGQYDEVACKRMILRTIPPIAENNMSLCLSWAFDQVLGAVIRKCERPVEAQTSVAFSQ